MSTLRTIQMTEGPAPPAPLPKETLAFYRAVMQGLQSTDVPFLVGGAYAFASYTGITRDTKDLDIFVRPKDHERALAILAKRRIPHGADLPALARQGPWRPRLRRHHLQLRQRSGHRRRGVVRARGAGSGAGKNPACGATGRDDLV